MKRTEAARILRATAEEWIDEGVQHWGQDDEDYDPDMVEAYEKDANDLREIANMVLAGETADAAKRADYLDTVVRDLIPNSVYNWLMDEWENYDNG